MKRTPWNEWFAFAVGALRMAPEKFWRLSLWEWLALISPRASDAPTREELEALLRKDREQRDEECGSESIAAVPSPRGEGRRVLAEAG